VGAAGFGVSQASGSASSPVPAAAPLAGPSPASLGDWKTRPTGAPALQTAKPKAAAEASGSGDSRLSDDVKNALLEKDKEAAVKKKAARSYRRSGSKKSDSGSVFRSGGNVNDPLNSKL
jgi:hypothetical protein